MNSSQGVSICQYCHAKTKFKLSANGTYACKICGAEARGIDKSFIMTGERFGGGFNLRKTKTVQEKQTRGDAKLEKDDIMMHLQDNWLEYLKFFQETLKINTQALISELNLDKKVENTVKDTWFKYLELWKKTKRRIVSFFSVTKRGLFKFPDPTFPKRRFNYELMEIQRLSSDSEGFEDDEEEAKNLTTGGLNYDFILSQNDFANTTAELKPEKPEEDEKQQKFRQMRSEFYKVRHIRSSTTTKQLRKKKPAPAAEPGSGTKPQRKRTLSHDMVLSSFERTQSAEQSNTSVQSPENFLMQIQTKYKVVSLVTLGKIVNDYIKVLLYQATINKAENQENPNELRTRRAHSSYFRRDFLEKLLEERRIHPGDIPALKSKLTLQIKAKELIFIHDFFCVHMQPRNQIIPTDLNQILKYISGQKMSEASALPVLLNNPALVDHIKKFLSDVLKTPGYEAPPSVFMSTGKKSKLPKTIPSLEHNLILVFLFLAMKQNHYPVLAKDIIEWAKQGVIPYFEAHKSIENPELKRYLLVPSNVPSEEWLLRTTKKIEKILDLEEIEANSLYVDRIILDLDIPQALTPHAHKIYKIIQTLNIKKKALKEPGIIAAGAIIATLKLFYGFDDCAYGIFLRKNQLDGLKSKVSEEVYENLTTIYEFYEQLKKCNSLAQFYKRLPPTSDLFVTWMDNLKTKSFARYFQPKRSNSSVAWDYEEIDETMNQQIEEYINQLKERFFDENSINTRFTDLAQTVSGLGVLDANGYQGEILKSEVKFDSQFASKAFGEKQYEALSKFFAEEKELIYDHKDEVLEVLQNMGEDDEEVEIGFPLPCDTYNYLDHVKSTPDDKLPREYVFLINYVSRYLNVKPDAVTAAVKTIDYILQTASNLFK